MFLTTALSYPPTLLLGVGEGEDYRVHRRMTPLGLQRWAPRLDSCLPKREFPANAGSSKAPRGENSQLVY